MREAASFIASQTSSAPAGVLSTIVQNLQAALHTWSGRRKLARLSEFDDHLLRDLGVTREDVRSALDLPFGYDPSVELQQRALRHRASGWRS